MIKSLIMDLSKESTELNNQVEEVLDNGELLDGTPVTAEKSSEIREMMDHAEKAREMSRQLNELADKADEILEEDKVHLVNEITTEAFQMNYRHIMEHAGLAEGVVSFESSDKVNELNYLSNEARKMAAVADRLEDRILDFSPEGKILSFFRRDRSIIKNVLKDLNKYTDPTKNNDEIVLRHKSLMKFFVRGDRPIKDLETELSKEVSILTKAEEQLRSILEDAKKAIDSGTKFDDFKKKDMDIFKEELLGNRKLGTNSVIDPSRPRSTHGDINTIALLKGMMNGAASAGLFLAITNPVNLSITAAAIVVHAGVNVAFSKEEVLQIELGKFNGIKSSVESLVKVLDHNRNELLFSQLDDSIKSLSGDEKRYYRAYVSLFARVQELIYEHTIFIMKQLEIILKRSA